MCGIAGIIGSSASIETVTAMTDRLSHRGPDGAGVWSAPGVVLGHRRLSILDLSHAADEPMVFGEHVLTYNGEIYNHQALRTELPGPWRSTGDTEVLLHLLARYGKSCLARTVGMFAFGSWDGAARRLLLARDRLGIKPLYYQILPDGIAFASELKALRVLGKPQIDASALRDFLFHGYVPAPKTIFRGISKLPAGHTLTWEKGRVSIERYWKPSAATTPRTADDTLQLLDELLRTVVPEHMLSDVPVGVFLSGGIDSALTTYYLDRPHTFTLGFEASDRSELQAARSAAAHFQTVHTDMTAQAADFEQALAAIAAIFDEPFADSAAWSNYLIAQFARRQVTVALSGEGGDEVFCGYPRYWSRRSARAFLARDRLRLSVVLPAVLARGSFPARAAAVARSAHGSGGGAAHQSGSDQHGAFPGGAASVARPPAGRVHAERRPCAPGR
jgi:asparagine synthase (glutamine-hydrolysing)